MWFSPLCATLLLLLVNVSKSDHISADGCLDGNLPVGLMVRLYYSKYFDQNNMIDNNNSSGLANIHCTAMILNANWLLSPASCLADLSNPNRYQLRDSSVHNLPQPIVLKKIIPNSAFNNELGAGYDLALLNVEQNMILNEKCKIHLPPPRSSFNVNSCKQIKWSQTSDKVEHADIRILVPKGDNCAKYAKVVDPNLVECAGSPSSQTPTDNRVGVCRRETGAVIVCERYGEEGKYYLRDMSSWGDIFCKTSPAYYYTSVSSYFDWINTTISMPKNN